MLVSVLISNYNYGRFVGAAIDSALGQTYGEAEVIVVDDGSTDDSRAVIESYGRRVIPVFKDNGGQVSALNAAFDQSRGELVCFLDADDVFEPDKVEHVVAAAREMPDAYLVHHQLQIIDADGHAQFSPFPRHVPHGDLRDRTIRGGGWFSHAVSSALTFRRSYAERLFPVPADCLVRVGDTTRRISTEADTYLCGPAALLAPVAGIQGPLARYRLHGENRYAGVDPVEAVHRYEAESIALVDVMREKFGQAVDIDIDNHLTLQLKRCAAGELSRPRTVARVLSSPSLPLPLRLRESVRVAANRGEAAR